MSSSLAPALLLSMPQMLDPNFSRTVVLLCSHSQESGAFGLVVNRPVMTNGRVVVNLEPPVSTDVELRIWVGGPVEPERSWILVGENSGEPEERRGTRIADGIYLSTDPDLLRRMFAPSPPEFARLVVGYSGWAPGQLDNEILRGDWLVLDADAETAFRTDASRLWQDLVKRARAVRAAPEPQTRSTTS